MRKVYAWGMAAACLVALLPGRVSAQEPVTISGEVLSEVGAPIVGASVFIEALGIGTLTNQEGRYVLIVPAARATGQEVRMTASMIGSKTLTKQIELTPGARVTENFTLQADPLKLEEIVATGSGTQRERRKVAVTVNKVDAEEIERSQETNPIAALAGKAPNVNVVQSSGEPGGGTFIRIRGASSITGGVQPLIVVDGQPVDNSSEPLEGTGNPVAGTAFSNRAIDINPADIESVEILKGAAATSIWGSRGANGVVVITTKRGTRGGSRVSASSSVRFDEINQIVPLQTEFGQGLVDPDDPTQNIAPTFPTSYGPRLPEGTQTFEHGDEVFETGVAFENNVIFSGGTERTTYYLSLGRLDHDGFIVGPLSEYDRTTVRLKGTHQFLDNLEIGGNAAYTDSEGGFIQQGSNISGLLLGALRTPPEFNNCLPEADPCYVDPVTGLHRSYRNPNPKTLTARRGYDNPFWIAFEIPNETEVGRIMGNINVNYRPFNWLRLDYTLGADYVSDQRVSLFPKSSSEQPDGKIIRGDFIDKEYNSLLVATATRDFGPNIGASLTLGQNLNQREEHITRVEGQKLIFGAEQLDFTIDRVPDEFTSIIRTDGYFAEANGDLYNQLFLTARVRADASSTFGRDDNRFWYPGVAAAWEFTQNEFFRPYENWLSFGKIRANWGQVGRQPPVFSNVTGFEVEQYTDGWINIGLETNFAGFEGVVPDETLGNEGIDPEVKTEWEVGADLSFFDERLNLGITRYESNTEDAIIPVDVAPSTGFVSRWANAAEFESEGWEFTADFIPVRMENASWAISANLGLDDNCVTSLGGTEEFALNGFAGATSSVVAPDTTEGGDIICHPFGVLFGSDFVRFGRDILLDVDGDGVPENIDQAFPNAQPGEIFIAADGFPIQDPRERVIGDPFPDWTLGIRNTITISQNLVLSGLIDFVQGQDMWNGTKGALFFFGTHESTLPFHGAGEEHVFGCGEVTRGDVRVCENPEGVAGPGVGEAVPLNWATWTISGLGSGFTGPSSQFVEDASFIKLRDISLSYTLTQDWLTERLGIQSAQITVSGQNLATWTDYSGIDPESNLTGQSAGRGLDYFQNPRARALVFQFSVNR